MEVEQRKMFAEKSSDDMDRFVCDGNKAVDFRLVRNVGDLSDSSLGFKPEMCHQVFNEGETIFGYENLKIKVYFTAGSLKTYMGVEYKRKVPKSQSEGVEPDDVVSKMGEVLRGGYTSNLDEFSGWLEAEQKNFHPMGELLNNFSHPICINSKIKDLKLNGSSPMNGNGNGNGHHSEDRTFEIYTVDAVSSKFRDYLLKMESFLLFYIDAATFVDESDDKWRFFVMFEKYKTSEGNTAYGFVGYSSVYQFYSYPDCIRPRVGQMLILPPYQKQGLAGKLLSCVYSHYRTNPKVNEITVEDPSDEFERLRDYIDSIDCKKLGSYAPEKLKKGYSKEMAEDAQKVLKMTKRQARRIYEILRLAETNIHKEEEFKNYRLDVKKRLNIPYQKQESDIKRMMRRKFDTSELQKATALDDQTRKTELESNFQMLLAHYQSILKRIENYGS